MLQMLLLLVVVVGVSGFEIEVEGEAMCLCSFSNQSTPSYRLFRHQGQLKKQCECTIEKIDSLNAQLNPLLGRLAHSAYFRFFRVDLENGCRFWQTAAEMCTLKECATTEVPTELEARLSVLDRQVDQSRIAPEKREERLDSRWTREDEHEARFIDLTLNPEQYTGYQGERARRVWAKVYENVYPEDDMAEHKVFNHLVSGLHTSISVHIARKYLIAAPDTWGVDLDQFQRRVNHERLRNLYFIHLLIQQSLVKGSETILSFDGMEEGTREVLEQVLAQAAAHPRPNEALHVFEQDAAQIADFRAHFYLLSEVFDCIGCFRCRLWGKLQLKGLAAGLRLLYAPEEATNLLHNDIVALLNLAHCLSDSVKAVSELQPMLTNQLLDGSNRCVVFQKDNEDKNPMNQFRNEL